MCKPGQLCNITTFELNCIFTHISPSKKYCAFCYLKIAVGLTVILITFLLIVQPYCPSMKCKACAVKAQLNSDSRVKIYFFLHRGHLYHRDVCPDGLLEAEQLRGWSVRQWDEVFLQLCWEGSGRFTHTQRHYRHPNCFVLKNDRVVQRSNNLSRLLQDSTCLLSYAENMFFLVCLIVFSLMQSENH